MIARLQQFITSALMLFVLGWAAYFLYTGKPAWAFGGLAIVVGGYVLCLGFEFLCVAKIHGDDPIPAADTRSLWRAWFGEVVTAPRVFCWRQPFRSMAEPDFLPAEARARRGIVFLHGFFCNRGFWNPWMARLRARGSPFVAVNLEPMFGSIDAYLDTVEAAVQRVEQATGMAPVIVAHSMGGLVARAWLGAQPDRRRAHRVVTIGTPHRGTWLARFGRTLNGRQMRMQSPWLVELLRREEAFANSYEHFTCFYSSCDNIVFPASTATLPGADNRAVPGQAHVQMAFAPAIFDHVVQRWLVPT